MSKFTINIDRLLGREYFEGTSDTPLYDLGLEDYVIHDESYREVLNKKIYDHYRFREIGLETPDLFKHFLNMTMNEIMPYYKEIYTYQLSMLEKDIFQNFDQTEEFDRNTEGDSTSTSSSSGTGSNKAIFNDTPQGEITEEEIDAYSYATNITKSGSESENTVEDVSELSNTESYVKHITGNVGARYYPEVMSIFIKNLMNIDMEIISKLEDLFMSIY